jgi:hypothetical protein
MKTDSKTAIAELDSILAEGLALTTELTSQNANQISALYRSAIGRLAPPSTSYVADSQRHADQYTAYQLASYPGLRHNLVQGLEGILRALRSDLAAGRTLTFAELIHSELFSDFLEMAEYLLNDEKLKDPAAVLAGGVLEEHLRKLCGKEGLDTDAVDSTGSRHAKKLDTLNADLSRKGTYGKNEQKQITAWAGIRNDAAHGHFDKYGADQVILMLQGIRAFMGRNPA